VCVQVSRSHAETTDQCLQFTGSLQYSTIAGLDVVTCRKKVRAIHVLDIERRESEPPSTVPNSDFH
jgi:hypothetical protein